MMRDSNRLNGFSGRKGLQAGLAVCVALYGSAQTAGAHHSFAMYDTKITRTFTGRLTQFIPGANHAQIIFELIGPDGGPVIGADGKPELWGVETGPAAQLARQGVTLESFPVGTVLNVNLNPLRDGRNFGALAREGGRLINCGTALPEGGCDAATGTVFLGDD
jgi:hypothetical protein